VAAPRGAVRRVGGLRRPHDHQPQRPLAVPERDPAGARHGLHRTGAVRLRPRDRRGAGAHPPPQADRHQARLQPHLLPARGVPGGDGLPPAAGIVVTGAAPGLVRRPRRAARHQRRVRAGRSRRPWPSPQVTWTAPGSVRGWVPERSPSPANTTPGARRRHRPRRGAVVGGPARHRRPASSFASFRAYTALRQGYSRLEMPVPVHARGGRLRRGGAGDGGDAGRGARPAAGRGGRDAAPGRPRPAGGSACCSVPRHARRAAGDGAPTRRVGARPEGRGVVLAPESRDDGGTGSSCGRG
jgi:hypothetical protein